MKTRSSFWSLLKNELGAGRFWHVALVAAWSLTNWLFLAVVPFLALFGEFAAHGNLASLFEAGLIPIMAFVFLLCITAITACATVPALAELLPPGEYAPFPVPTLEYLFTRAINRRLIFRARTTSLCFLFLAPLFLDLAMSPFLPETYFGIAESNTPEAIRRYEQYRRTFPTSHAVSGHAVSLPGQIIIPHGGLAYAAWLAWSVTFAFVLLQGYGVLIAKRVKPNNWWTALYPAAPILGVLLSMALWARGVVKLPDHFCEHCFLFFSTHPVALVLALLACAAIIQTWCERKFSKLEVS